MDFLCLFLKYHFVGKSVVVSWNDICFLRRHHFINSQSLSQFCVGGCCVLKLYKGYALCSFGVKLPCVNPTSLRADSQWIIILKTFELVTLSFSKFHAQRNWLLTHALHILNQYMRLLCYFWSLMWLKKIENCFFRRICMESSEHNWANISETICPEMLVFGK